MGGALPLISFIIPCYGQARYLPSAVNSTLRQAAVEIETIVVDDGSPDDPIGLLGPLAQDPRVRCIRQENAGLPAARNRGIRESRGSYLNFLDADDWLGEGFGAELSLILRANPRLGFAYSDLQRVAEGVSRTEADEGYSVGASRRQTSGDILPSLLLGGYFTPHCVLVPRPVLDEAGPFDEKLGGHADWDLWLRIAARGWPAHYVDKRLAYYRVHDHNMSRDRDHMTATQLAVLQKLFRGYPERCGEAIQCLIRNVNDAHRVNQRLCGEFATLDEEYRKLLGLRKEDALRCDATFREQREWIAKLDEAKTWQERQAKHWEAETGRLLSLLDDQRNWIAQLTARKEELERELAAAGGAAAEP
jgi:glycosyltransferase involved in cell wall biosynthesis